LTEQDVEGISLRFIQLLSKENVQSGNSVKEAEDLLKSRKTKEVINNTLPEAWNRVISEPDEIIVELVLEKVESLCGHKPSQNVIKKFFDRHKAQFSISEEVPKVEVTRDKKAVVTKRERIPTRRANRMILNGIEYDIRYPSVEILVNTAEWLISKKKLGSQDCPIKFPSRSVRNLVNTRPEHDHRGFLGGKQLSNGLWIECHNSIPHGIDLAIKLLSCVHKFLYFELM